MEEKYIFLRAWGFTYLVSWAGMTFTLPDTVTLTWSPKVLAMPCILSCTEALTKSIGAPPITSLTYIFDSSTAAASQSTDCSKLAILSVVGSLTVLT